MTIPLHLLTYPAYSISDFVGSRAEAQASASSANPDLHAQQEERWADPTVQHCLDLCSDVNLVYKLLIQEIQPVLGNLCLVDFQSVEPHQSQMQMSINALCSNDAPLMFWIAGMFCQSLRLTTHFDCVRRSIFTVRLTLVLHLVISRTKICSDLVLSRTL